MSILDISNKQLLANIRSLHERRAKMNLALHVAACQCVWRAATPEGGRVEPLQALYDILTKAERGMLLAWLSKKANTFAVADQSKAWLSSKNEKFTLVGGAVAHRPTREAIENVAKDMERFFLNKSVGEANRQLTWEEELPKKLAGLVAYMAKYSGDDKLNEGLVNDAKLLQSNVIAFLTKRNQPSVVVDKPEPKQPAEVVDIERPHKGRRVVRDLAKLGEAIGELPQVVNG